MTFRSIYWDDDQARIKGFSATTKSDAVSVVKIEIEVRDPFRLGVLLQELSEIRREQGRASRPSAHQDPVRPTSSKSAAKLTAQPPLLLTYRED